MYSSMSRDMRPASEGKLVEFLGDAAERRDRDLRYDRRLFAGQDRELALQEIGERP